MQSPFLPHYYHRLIQTQTGFNLSRDAKPLFTWGRVDRRITFHGFNLSRDAKPLFTLNYLASHH